MPKPIVDKLAKAFEKVVNDPEIQEFTKERNADPMYLPPDKAFQYFEELEIVFRETLEKAGLSKEK